MTWHFPAGARLLAAAAVAGCAGNIKQMEQSQATGGTAFTQAIFQRGYRRGD